MLDLNQSEAIMAICFPGEDPNYRDARNHLLEAEMQLRTQLESVAALRRELPVGGRIPQNYVFNEDNGQVLLSQLFKPETPTLIVYNFMFGPAILRLARRARPLSTASAIRPRM
jgi:predicted dithiol-disulfide oxidoreductase (DUF899 family)